MSVIVKEVPRFCKKNVVLIIALVAALITTVIVPVDKNYIGYFDFKTLTCLFCVLAVVCALKNINFFYSMLTILYLIFKKLKKWLLKNYYKLFLHNLVLLNNHNNH